MLVRTFMTYRWSSIFIAGLFLLMMALPLVSADSDGDGIADSSDDCKWSYGTSSVDKVGCPDRDNDGTSDFNDGWAANNPNFENEFTISSNQDYNDVDFSSNSNCPIFSSGAS